MADRYAGFAEFVDARGPALMRTASLLTRDVGHAEDALQEALTKAALKWRSISRDGNPEPYVRQVLYTVTVDRWRWRSRRAPEVGPADGPTWHVVPLDGVGSSNPMKWEVPPYWNDQVVLPNTVVMGLNPEGGHLASSGGPFYRISTPDARFFMSIGGRRLLWGALADGYFVLIRPGYAEPGDPNEVLRLDDGGQHELTTVPQNTAAVSFATDLR